MRIRLILLTLLAPHLVVLPLRAEPTIQGETKMPRDSLVRLVAKDVDPKAGLRWRVYPSAKVSRATTTKERLEFCAPPGIYEVELLVLKQGPDGALDLEESTTTVTIGEGKPDPGPGPTPPPDPTPVPIGKAWLVLIEESADATAERGKMIADKDIVGFVKSRGWRWRIADKDVVDASGKPPADLVPYLERGKLGLPRLTILAESGKVLWEGKPPSTAPELLSLLKKVGG